MKLKSEIHFIPSAFDPVTNACLFVNPLQDTSFGTVVSRFTASDADSGTNAVIVFRVVNNVPFRFDSANLIVNGPLDRETSPQYSVSKILFVYM